MMIEYSLEYKGVDEQLQKLKDYDRIASSRVKHAMGQSVETITGNVVPLVPVGVSSRLRNSIGSKVTGNNLSNITGIVGSSLKNEKYPAVMEFGREPGSTFPPVNALLRWVELKIRPGKDLYQVTYLIARKIAQRGIKGKKFMQRGFNKSKSRITAFFDFAIREITKDLSNGR